jgi:hypothetical protein
MPNAALLREQGSGDLLSERQSGHVQVFDLCSTATF